MKHKAKESFFFKDSEVEEEKEREVKAEGKPEIQIVQAFSTDNPSSAETMHNLPPNPTLKNIPQFNWDWRWLRGYEYEFILKNVHLYVEKFDFKIYDDHPLYIYE